MKKKDYSTGFYRANKISLILTFLVILAGSIVRTSGSGMGCPDWPTCFGKIIPPTDQSELPPNYLDKFLEKRIKKVNRFTSLLNQIGLEELAKKIKSDPSIYKEEEFNARKTWTEYINRLLGVFAGFSIAVVFFWSLSKYRNNKILLLAFINSIILIFQAWFGSIVVATNLVPWTVTIHMLLAVFMLMIEVLILFKIKFFCSKKSSKKIQNLVLAVFIICFIQMILGSQVRQEFDYFYLNGVKKINWLDIVSIKFLIHRSFSWIVLILIFVLFWLNKKLKLSIKQINILTGLLILELISGIILAYVNVPAIAQTIHLILACLIFIISFYLVLYSFKNLYH